MKADTGGTPGVTLRDRSNFRNVVDCSVGGFPGVLRRGVRRASLDVRALTWGPRKGHDILHPVSFSLAPGEKLAIVGPNGAGKTTLLRLLFRYRKPTGGRVLLDGEDIGFLPERRFARKVAVVLQSVPAEFPFTLRQVVALGRNPHRSPLNWTGLEGPEDVRAINHALNCLRLRDMESRLLSDLSGGERQRVMLAMALAQEPSLLILDEPTNQLDIRYELETLQLLGALDATVVCTLHDLNTATAFADRMLLLSRGRTLAHGSADEVLSASHVREAFGVRMHSQTLLPSGVEHRTFSLMEARIR